MYRLNAEVQRKKKRKRHNRRYLYQQGTRKNKSNLTPSFCLSLASCGLPRSEKKENVQGSPMSKGYTAPPPKKHNSFQLQRSLVHLKKWEKLIFS
jgi:hypothetical protein